MLIRFLLELANTKLHTLLLDHHKIKLSWLIDWNKKEVMFNVDNAFSAKNKWFSFGFSKRGEIEHSDICFFTKENDIFDIALVSNKLSNFKIKNLFVHLSRIHT